MKSQSQHTDKPINANMFESIEIKGLKQESQNRLWSTMPWKEEPWQY